MLQCTAAAQLRSGPQSRPPQSLPPAARLRSAHKYRSAAGPRHQPAQLSAAAPVIRCRSSKVCNWICHCCPKGRPHRWQAPAYKVCLGSGCSCCSGHRACICNSLQSLFPEVAAEWDLGRNPGTPADYPAGSGSKVWWYSDKRGSFQSTIKNRTAARRKSLDSQQVGAAVDVQIHCKLSYYSFFCSVLAADSIITFWQHPCFSIHVKHYIC